MISFSIKSIDIVRIVLIFRYIVKEVIVTLISLTAILMLIFMSNQLVRYLSRAIGGQFPVSVIFKLMLLEIPNLSALLLPLGLYIALLIALGRLYQDSEMIVLHALGFTPKALLMQVLSIASIIFLAVFILVMWINPKIAQDRETLIRTSGLKTLIQTLAPEQFTALPGSEDVLYISSMNKKHTEASDIFLFRKSPKSTLWRVVFSKKATIQTKKDGEDYLILSDGKEYAGIPGQADYEIVSFKTLQMKLPTPTLIARHEMRSISFWDLSKNFFSDSKKRTEWVWRFSMAWMTFTLALLAVPLSRVNPRSGKFAKLLPAILIYILYANFLFIVRDGLFENTLPGWFGMSLIHIMALFFGIFLYRRYAELSRVL